MRMSAHGKLSNVSILITGLVILGVLWFFGSFLGTDVTFRSSDAQWVDRTIESKGRGFFGVVYQFEAYRIKCGVPSVQLQRVTEKPSWYLREHWFNDYSDPKWQVSLWKPVGGAETEVYKPDESFSCLKRGLTAIERERVRSRTVEFIARTSHNKSLNADASDAGAG